MSEENLLPGEPFFQRINFSAKIFKYFVISYL